MSALKVLVVDDSSVFRTQIKFALRKANIEIVGACANGKDAIEFLKRNSVDVMTLDLEMPEMNGIQTLEEIRRSALKVKVIVFAANTTRGAMSTFDALRLGALDVVAKPNNDNGGGLADAGQRIFEDLVPKILQFASKPVKISPSPVKREQPISIPKRDGSSAGVPNWARKELTTFRPEIIVVGSSTGGPVALENFLKGIPAPLSVPIVIVQHMPPKFTQTLASRLADQTGIPCQEASNGEPLTRDKIYIAPGDYHLEVFLNQGKPHLVLKQGPKRCSVRPSVDFLFESAASIFGPKTMGFILTGMGEDGKDGCIAIKESKGGVMIQDKESSVVWGMPGAVHSVKAFDRIGSIDDCRLQIIDILTRNKAA